MNRYKNEQINKMFTKLPSVTSYSNEVISIKDLYDIVRNNKDKEIINKLRTIEYKSSEYKRLKTKLQCITPHGIFSSLKNNSLKKFSGYLFYDIDGIYDEQELDDTISTLNDTFDISFIQKSISNKGLHFLIKVDDTLLQPNDTFSFDLIYSYVRNILINNGFNIDISASGISRKMIISNDKDCILNIDKVFKINIEDLNRYRHTNKNIGITPNDTFKRIKTIQNQSNKNIGITPNDTLRRIKTKQNQSNKNIGITPNDTFKIIEIGELLKQIKTQTVYSKNIDGDFVIEDMEYYTILIPEEIKDGTKHKLFTRIVNALYFINGNISRTQVISYLYYINNRCTPSMDEWYLRKFINNLCDSIEQNGVRIKPRIKRIHFNKDSNITKKEKQSMGAKVAATVKRNKSLELIQWARLECAKLNEIPTQKKVQELTGLSIATVKRNWNKDIIPLEDIVLERLPEGERGEEKEKKHFYEKEEPKFDEIDIDDFFGEK